MEQAEGTVEAKNIYQICRQSARHDTGISFYSSRSQNPQKRLNYQELLERAHEDAARAANMYGMRPGPVIFLYFDRHQDSIGWFWSLIVAGHIPAIFPSLTSDTHQRNQDLGHIIKLLGNPIVLTTKSLATDFSCQQGLRVRTVDSLWPPLGPSSQSKRSALDHLPSGALKRPDELAILMLTSGSSGNPKAVCLQHGQIIHALKGKIAFHQTKQEDRFLNYIGLDHVANMTEIHLHAMYLGAEQWHVAGSKVMVDPLLLPRLIHEHRISYTFATRSLLAMMVRELKNKPLHELDLNCLKAMITGGDAVSITICNSLIEILQSYGAVENFLQPGFGMTETCAGCTYNKAYSEYEREHNLEYASQGNPTQAVAMRIASTYDEEIVSVPNEKKRSLQVRGPAVFSEYFNDAQATKDAFTHDGWFKTGDDAVTYPDGHLVILGRAKTDFVLGDKKFVALDFETAAEKADIPGLTPYHTVCLPQKTESICMLYVPERGYGDAQARARIADAMAGECVRISGVVPWDIIAVDAASLSISSLGKIARVKTQKAYERGAFFKFRGSASI